MIRAYLPAAMLLVTLPAFAGADETLPTLRFVAAIPIADKSAGLSEPSGLALAGEGDRLWVVSDDTRRVFQIGHDGVIRYDETFGIDSEGLEGIAADPATGHLLAVAEETGEIIVIDVEAREVAARVALAQMQGFERIAAGFSGSSPNKGLEGITVDPATGRVFVLKEAEPRLLIEISPDLTAITGHRILSGKSGFTDDDRAEDRVDVSGIAFDPVRGRIWIVSDEARRIYLYDWSADHAASAPLDWDDNGRRRPVEHAEGVTVDAAGNRLYVVSDDGKRSRLFIYEIEQNR